MKPLTRSQQEQLADFIGRVEDVVDTLCDYYPMASECGTFRPVDGALDNLRKELTDF